ncbi:hypothetical protein BDZ94DRAFT_196311 [Collybia nuda]|uniref:Uncharacterized protein n=1 Tax=Collybia nuda TaxID=64659 RepID=A0A9P5XXS4_9AGAR|nr:hypothetical protein BDZ94DRAFT_196311 [Collybia nuda]
MRDARYPSMEEREIPTELLEIIVGLVHDDHTALKALAATSHRSLRQSQRLLFSSIILGQPDHSDIGLSPCQKLHNVMRESPHLATYVRHLSIIDGARHIDQPLHGWLGFLRNISPCREGSAFGWVAGEKTLPEVLCQLVNVEHLVIRGSISPLDPCLNWGKLPMDTRLALLATVQRPLLSSISISHTSAFIPLLSCATGPKSVILSNNCVESCQLQDMALQHPPQRICQIDTLDTGVSLNRDWSMLVEYGSWIDLSQLRSLTVRGTGSLWKHRELIQQLFKSSATLENLHVYLPSPCPPTYLTSLNPFLCLRSLCVDICPRNMTSGSGYATWLLQLISTVVNPNSIDTLAFQVSYSPLRDLFTPEEFTSLDIALSRPELSSLKLVRLKAVGVERERVIEYYQKLPSTHARKILSIETDTERGLQS